MLDINFIIQHPDKIKKACSDKQVKVDIDKLLDLDNQRRNLIKKIEKLYAEQNAMNPQIAKAEKNEKQKMIDKMRAVKAKLVELEPELKKTKKEWKRLMLEVPNIPSQDMPIGKNEEDNIEINRWGDFQEKKWTKNHIDIGKKLDLIDIEQSAKVSGSRFSYLKNQAVLLQDALYLFLRDELLKRKFIPMIPPVLVKEKALIGTSHFPKGKNQVYKIENEFIEKKENLYLIGSSEPSLFAYYMGKTLNIRELPRKMFAMTSCFRTEVGSWGKDVRGIKRVHQFDKLEMDVVCAPNQSEEIFEELLGINEWFLQSLKIPYRVINKCTADAGYDASYLQYDIEVWLPSQKEFMETMTDTNATDFQARRLNIKYKDKDGKRNFCHTVNDTGCAMGRMIIAIIENYQEKDGSVRVPDVLQKYMNGLKIIK